MTDGLRCKKIIGGKTYNTETSTCIHTRYIPEGRDIDERLYQTRHGAYFLYTYMNGAHFGVPVEEIKPLTPQEAQSWMEEHASAEMIEAHFGEMPEAGDTESRFTLRMPDVLKQRIDATAKLNNQSTNAWIIRCLENCLQR